MSVRIGSRSRCFGSAREGKSSSAAEVERITETLLTALRASGYPKLNSSDSFHGAVRRLVRRLHLQTGDAEFLLGMLRQMVWKMNKIGGQEAKQEEVTREDAER